MKPFDREALERSAFHIRSNIVRTIASNGEGHAGGALSAADILAVLYFAVMDYDPEDPVHRDKLLLSGGHKCLALYGAMVELGVLEPELLKTYNQLGTLFPGHPDATKLPCLDFSTGSLGQGVSIATGMALGAKTAKKNLHVYTLLGDGELQEGQVWEACTAAAHYGLDNLTVLIDNNGLQIDGTNDEVMSLGNLRLRFEAIGMDVIELADGNDLAAVLHALDIPAMPGRPRCILAHTVKGCGVSFMENQVGWHGKAPSSEELAAAFQELEGE